MLLIQQGGEKGTKHRPQPATEHRNDESDGAHLRLSYLNALTNTLPRSSSLIDVQSQHFLLQQLHSLRTMEPCVEGSQLLLFSTFNDQ